MKTIIVNLPEIAVLAAILKIKKVKFDELCAESFRAFCAWLFLVVFLMIRLNIENIFFDYANSSLIFDVFLEEFIKILFFSLLNKNMWNLNSVIIFGSVFSICENVLIDYSSYSTVIVRMMSFYMHSVFLLIYVLCYQYLKTKGFKGAFIPASCLGIAAHIFWDYVIDENSIVLLSIMIVLCFEFFRFIWKKQS